MRAIELFAGAGGLGMGISKAGFRLMVVSPELQGRSLDDEMENVTQRFVEAGVPLDGVCTKLPARWHRPETPWWGT